MQQVLTAMQGLQSVQIVTRGSTPVAARVAAQIALLAHIQAQHALRRAQIAKLVHIPPREPLCALLVLVDDMQTRKDRPSVTSCLQANIGSAPLA